MESARPSNKQHRAQTVEVDSKLGVDPVFVIDFTPSRPSHLCPLSYVCHIAPPSNFVSSSDLRGGLAANGNGAVNTSC